ncbi:unnamed protein product [Bursaphelenchus okinawaensis]|uniref:PurE domain-containing protein n=1 Tax=Bursaphelenchus okinawaensis TaxID=465554 RepID=A0A811L1A2_9BILA|nr:unnamed protein product [Bursaphelenchus okinawaensis]CAG9115708.1 unnamed protein product [Bursaphelenchus okinawaensis]
MPSSPIAQGKTKAIYAIPSDENKVLVKSLDSLTAFNAQRKNELEGKSAAASKTTCNIFRYLNSCGVKTHFIREVSDTEFEALSCQMIPIEWVARRIATGSFLKRNPGVKEGYTFTPPQIETFFKDDANDDPQWSRAQILEAGFKFNGRKITIHEYNWMSRATSVIFRILEKAWRTVGCVLVDMKIEFGVTKKGDLVLADVIDNDSWRVWPNGDRRLQLDKQVYRDLPQVTDEALREVKKNYERVAELTADFADSAKTPNVEAIIVMGSAADAEYGKKIASGLRKLGVIPTIRVCSAHKSTTEALELIGEFENGAAPCVLVAIAGRSNGLGPVLAANSILPVINAPPFSADWAAQDVWSSLRMPSGVGCATVLGADEVALAVAKILSSHSHFVHGKLLGNQLHNIQKIFDSDQEIANLSL